MGKTLLGVEIWLWSLAKRLLSDGREGALISRDPGLPLLGTAARMGRDGS